MRKSPRFPFGINTLYWKLSTAYLLLLVAAGAFLLVSFALAWRHITAESDQLAGWHLAEHLASKIEPFTKDTVDHKVLGAAVYDFITTNPNVGVYLLYESGEILDFAPRVGMGLALSRIDTKPIERFLEPDAPFDVPILVTHPSSGREEKVIFSAARIIISGQPGYLLVVLRSSAPEAVTSSIATSTALQRLTAMFFAGWAFSAFIGLILFRLITKRFYHLADTVRKIGGGDLESRVTVTSNDEIAELGLTINEMADTIASSLRKLERKDELRRELVANVSHDLRGPLAALSGYLETLETKGDHLSGPERVNCIAGMERAVRFLERLVRELFELSRYEAMETAPNMGLFSPEDLAEELVVQYRALAERRGQTLKVGSEREIFDVIGDAELIERVLCNLLENALRYTQDGGTIILGLENSGDKVCFRVTDTGAGIPEEDLPHIFEKFHRAATERPTVEESTGLGLAIVKRILELHGSEIRVESELGRGTTFLFMLEGVPS